MTCPDLASETSGSSSQELSSLNSPKQNVNPKQFDRCYSSSNMSSMGIDPSARSLSGHGSEGISESFRRDDGEDYPAPPPPQVSNSRTTSSSSSLDSEEERCFFPHHKTLLGDLPTKVVKYAHRRLRKVKLSSTSGGGTGAGSTASSATSGRAGLVELTHSSLELDALLGEGSFSSVYSLKSLTLPTTDDEEDVDESSVNPTTKLPSHHNLVVKVLRKKLLKNPPMLAACAADLVKEGTLLSRLSHENVLQVHAWTKSQNTKSQVDLYQSGRHDAFFLVVSRLETTLSDKFQQWRQIASQTRGWTLLQSRKTLSQKLTSVQERLQVVAPLLNAVTYLHSQNILHRDLKPDNIGFDAQGILKVFDFDVARVLPFHTVNGNFNSSVSTFQMTKRVGSPRYMSPECARGDPYNAKSDIYTVALLVHELISLEKPYDDIPSELHEELVFYQGSRPYCPATWPQSLVEWLEQSWSERLMERPTTVQMAEGWTAGGLHETVLQDKQRKYRNPKKSDTTVTQSGTRGSTTVPTTTSTSTTDTLGVMATANKNNHKATHKTIWESNRTSTTTTSYAEHSESMAVMDIMMPI